MKKIFVTGGAGYVGSSLVPKLLKEGYQVTVYDLMIYGENMIQPHENNGWKASNVGRISLCRSAEMTRVCLYFCVWLPFWSSKRPVGQAGCLDGLLADWTRH